MKMSSIFEVSVTVPLKVREQVIEFMKDTHINELLEHPAFSGATFFLETSDFENEGTFTTHYYFQDRKLLDDYLKNHAPRIRNEFIQKFKDVDLKFRRRVLEETKVFGVRT